MGKSVRQAQKAAPIKTEHSVQLALPAEKARLPKQDAVEAVVGSQPWLHLLHQPGVQLLQRQGWAAAMGKVQGNHRLSRALAGSTQGNGHGVLQRDSKPKKKRPKTAVDLASEVLQQWVKHVSINLSIQNFAQHLDWIDNLHPDLISQIDAQYAYENELGSFFKRAQKDADFAKMLAEYKKKNKIKKLKFNRDLLLALSLESLDTVTKWFEHHNLPVKFKPPPESLFTLPAAGVTWEQGRFMARVNFMSTMTSILGSVDKVKSHFRAVKEFKISGSTMLLYSPAGERLQQAALTFQNRHKGATFPRTTVAQSLRGRHQHRQSLGLHAHPLGIAVDYYAYENPHLKEKAFMLAIIGGGPARMIFRDPAGKLYNIGPMRRLVAKMGKETAANLPADQRDPKGKHLLDQVDKAYADMVQTSQNFQKSLGAEAKAKLHDLGTRYWQTYRGKLAALGASLAKDNKDLAGKRKKAEARVLKQLKAEYGPQLAEAKQNAKEALKTTFKGKALTQAINEHPDVVSILEAMKPDPAAVDAEGGVTDLVAKIEAQEQERDQLREEISKELKDILEPFTRLIDDKMATYPENDPMRQRLAGLRADLLNNFQFVFGEAGEKEQFKGSYYKKVDAPSILQLLEMGFVRYDPVPTPQDEGGEKPQGPVGTFNAEFFKVMLEHGWSPLAAAGSVDTMHFDFAEGFSLAAAQAKPVSYGPLGVGPPVKK